MPATADRSAPPPVNYRGQSAEVYEQLMGRWSRRLAPLLIRFGGLSDGDRVIDVGCGTGSLIFALPEIANIEAAIGVDLAAGYVEAARARNADWHITFQEADARGLPFDDASFDRAFSMLVLNFIPDATRAVAEMRRVVRQDGTVTAAVWDTFSGLTHWRMMWDIAVALDPSLVPPLFSPMTAPDEMATLWRELGMVEVEQTSLLIRMEFSSFEDYWRPFTTDESGFSERYITSLSEPRRARLTENMRRAYLADRPDGPRSFVSVTWAGRGTVPSQ